MSENKLNDRADNKWSVLKIRLVLCCRRQQVAPVSEVRPPHLLPALGLARILRPLGRPLMGPVHSTAWPVLIRRDVPAAKSSCRTARGRQPQDGRTEATGGKPPGERDSAQLIWPLKARK